MRPLALLTATILIAGCGGGTTPARHRTGLSAAPALPGPAPAGPSAATGVRSFAAVAGCLLTHHIPTSPYRPPAGVAVQSSAITPRVLLAMPWDAIAISVYKTPVARRSAITVRDAGAVMALGNVSLTLNQIPEPPPATMRTIEACVFGR